MFQNLKKALKEQHRKLESAYPVLHYVPIDRDAIWEEYLAGYPPEERQFHNCNCCKSFLRQWGGIVAITQDLQVISLWDIEVPGFEGPIGRLKNYVHSLAVTDIFVNGWSSCGTDKNFDSKRGVNWEHFHVNLDKRFVVGDRVDALKGQARTDHASIRRAITDFTDDAIDTVLDLIDSNSLYRGTEFRSKVQAVKDLKQAARTIPTDKLDLYCWSKINDLAKHTRNTAIGTLLVDLSEGMDMEAAVRRYEAITAPTNYRRPTAIITDKMIKSAKEELDTLGLTGALDRRYAAPTDLDISNILYTDRGKPLGSVDVFEAMSEDVIVDPSKLKGIEDVPVDKFLEEILPTCQGLEVLFEKRLFPNMCSLLTAQEIDSQPLFSWGNPFSWAYSGNVADSMKEKVKAAGGKVDGAIRISLAWSNYDDLDLHVNTPSGKIYYGNKYAGGGTLDVDMNAGGGNTREPVENVIFPVMPRSGKYKVIVDQFNRREDFQDGYSVEIECGGQIYTMEAPKNPRGQDTVAEFEVKDGKFTLLTKMAQKGMQKVTKWGVSTGTWTRVSNVMLSPNHWGSPNGNRHFMFMLKGCVSDEQPRAIFNEFLRPELNVHRKVFEVLGSKLKVPHSDDQLSGLGFSDTQRNSMIVRVTGQRQRLVRINF